jgi:hypothetical protein
MAKSIDSSRGSQGETTEARAQGIFGMSEICSDCEISDVLWAEILVSFRGSGALADRGW